MMDIKSLQEQFRSNKALTFRQHNDDLIFIDISNSYANATVCLQGAQVIQWTPVGHEPVIWVSGNSYYQTGRSVRGGIPICWPWFGDHVTDASLPAHGFVRAKKWALESADQIVDGSTQLIFTYQLDKADQAIWPYSCTLQMVITLGSQLQLSLQTSNTGQQPLMITEALHTYFKVGDISKTTVMGLEGCHYLDKVDDFAQKIQDGRINIQTEVDRIYLDTTKTCRIDDPLMNRSIIINKEGSHSTVVWNPWEARSTAMIDMGKQAYQGMLCVETANAASNRVIIEAGDSHCMAVSYHLGSL